MSKLQLKSETIRVLVSNELDAVMGGQGFAQPTATAVSSARPAGGGGVAQPTATAVSSARPGAGGGVAQATATARPGSFGGFVHATATAVNGAIHATSSVFHPTRW